MTETAARTTADPSTALATFRERRELSVRQPKGSLALVNTQWISGGAQEEQAVWGIPGTWSPRANGESGLVVKALASDNIVVDGVRVDGEAIVHGKDDESPSEVVFSDSVSGFVIAGADGYALRVWDAKSEAVESFGSIDAYEYNPEWVVNARFTPNEARTTVGFEHVKDEGRTRELVVPGEITFTKDGIDYNLAAFASGRALQLVFSDATSGDTTYSVGRFLFLAPNADGSVILDFNRAILPPCAFSYSFNCPMPPKQNRFSAPIPAGEKNVLNAQGELLH